MPRGGSRPVPTNERFWNKVFVSLACWEWTAARQTNGYGRIMHNGRPTAAHRVAWELVNGPIPEGMSVLHRCDNRICVRPEHLFLGTYKDNSDDKIAKGRARYATGDRNGNSKVARARRLTMHARGGI